MLLHHTTATATAAAAVHHHHRQVRRVSFSSSVPNLPSSPSRFSRSAGLTSQNSSAIITCSSISQVHNYGTVDYEKRPALHWYTIYRRISMIGDPRKGSAATVLDQCENEGKKISKSELSRIVNQLRRFRRHKFALEVYEWMNDRAERFNVTPSDTAIQLDLIAKVHGISNAEAYFLALPNSLKGKRTYGALLNAYVKAGTKEKAESLFDELRNRGYASTTLAYNVMMTLYMNHKDYDELEHLVSEMTERNIPLDVFSYNIWLTSRGYRGSREAMERAFERMKADSKVNPNWTTYSIMASIYMKMGESEKAGDCLKQMERRITGRDRTPYHHLVSLYGSFGNREEVHRVWDAYKSIFPYIPNMGYHSVISSLVRLDDIGGAEKIFDEWSSVQTNYDPRIANLLLSFYTRKELLEKAEGFFARMIEAGGKPNSMTWEIVAEGHLKRRRLSEALSCLKNAASAEGSRTWKPRSATVSSFLALCEKEDDMESKELMIEMLKQSGCLDHEDYEPYIVSTHRKPKPDTEKDSSRDNDDERAELLLTELQGSF